MLTLTMLVLLQSLTFTAGAFCVGWAAYVCASIALPVERASVRLSGAAIIAFWGLAATFYCSSLVHGFRLVVMLPLWVILVSVAHFAAKGIASPVAQARTDSFAVRTAAHSAYYSTARVPLLLFCAFAGLRVLRGLVAPPMEWDSLTYHLVKAARAVQSGGIDVEEVPDSPAYYQFFAELGDVYWAWAMLPFHSDAGLALASGFIFGGLWLALYAIARERGVAQSFCALFASTACSTPAIMAYVTSYHVEITQAALFCLGVLFLLRFTNGADWMTSLFSAAAFGLSVGMKFTMLVMAALPMAVLAYGLIRRKVRLRAYCAFATVALTTLVIALATQWRAWNYTGSPLYPMPFKLPGQEPHPGNALFMDLVTGRLINFTPREETWLDKAFTPVKLFIPSFHLARSQYQNFTPIDLIINTVGFVAFFLHGPRRRTVGAFLIFVMIYFLAGLFSPISVGHRSFWLHTTGRLLLPAFLSGYILCVISLQNLQKWEPLFVAGLFISLLLGFPIGMGFLDIRAIAEALGWIVLVTGTAWFLFGRPSTNCRSPAVRAFAAACLSTLAIATVLLIRPLYRDKYYAAVGEGQIYFAHRLAAYNRVEYPIWSRVDTAEPKRIAFTAGNRDYGQNWFRYPLFGSRLQNQVLYVSPTVDGRPVDARHKHKAELSFELWLKRLKENRITHLVLAGPPTIEHAWAANRPDLFELLVQAPNGTSRLYGVRKVL